MHKVSIRVVFVTSAPEMVVYDQAPVPSEGDDRNHPC
jgi:hypothetical protein